jgi:PST family polysaccharide transporter
MSLGKKVFSSAVLLFIRKIWGNVINLVVMAFLARLLSKEDFGLLAISSVFLSIINTLATSGVAEYVVYYDGEDKPAKLNAAFWLNLFLTLAVIAIVVSTGKFWAAFYQNEKIYSLLLLLSVSFFFEMGSTIPKALLRKELEYRSLVYFTTVSMTVVSVGKLGAAFAGFGVYSLALPQAIVSPFLMIVFFIKTKWRPLADFGISHFKSIFNYTKHIIGGRVLTKLVNEGDNLIVGKFIGLEGLGVYALAFQLANLVTTNVVFIANDIFLPLFSKVKGDVDRLRDLYIRMIRFLSFISFPLITALAISAPSIVRLIYGEKWIDAILPFQILCLFAVGRSISSPSSALFNAVGKPKINFHFALFFTPVFLVSVYIGSLTGVLGVAISTTLIRLLGSIISILLALKLIGFSPRHFFILIRRNIFVSIVILPLLLIPNWDEIIVAYSLFFIITIPMIIYIQYLLHRFLFKNEFIKLVNEIKMLLGDNRFIHFFNRIFFLPTRANL